MTPPHTLPKFPKLRFFPPKLTKFGMQKNTWSIYKSFGNWEDPPPPLWEKFPNNPVIFFWVRTLTIFKPFYIWQDHYMLWCGVVRWANSDHSPFTGLPASGHHERRTTSRWNEDTKLDFYWYLLLDCVFTTQYEGCQESCHSLPYNRRHPCQVIQ